MSIAPSRRDRLVEVYNEARDCQRCALAESRTKVVFGAGNADADLMFVGEAPGAEEDRTGLPFVGRAGGLLNELLEGIGMTREDVFIANVLKCLRYDAQVQLGDGSWERIGRLVRSRFDGEVMSLDEDGVLVPRRVKGWHATPLGGRSVYRLSYRSAKVNGATKAGVELTGDHPVLTERGYVEASQLRAGDRVATGQGLSALAHDVICGTVLGDGTISSRSNHITFGHSQRQREYAMFKATLLRELSPQVQELEVAAVSGGARIYPVIHVRTLAHRAVGVLRSDFYAPTKRVPGWLADRLNPRMLAIWFMDDGYTRIRPPRQPLAEIATVSFDDADLQVLLLGLRRLGLNAKASRSRLYFNVEETKRLSEMIAPYVPESMRYKLHPEVEPRIPFDPRRVEQGGAMTLYDEVEIEDISDRDRADTTFFCLDVDETHNFVTSGGIVHNCRPPGNRDPQPVEIETCSPYLHKQVELIQPKVVGTLGNFATKLLTGSQTGITKVRGTTQVHVLGGRAVYIMPLLHPAAALRTPSLVDTLKGDFAKFPELLATPSPQEVEDARRAGEPEVAVGVGSDESDQLDLLG